MMGVLGSEFYREPMGTSPPIRQPPKSMISNIFKTMSACTQVVTIKKKEIANEHVIHSLSIYLILISNYCYQHIHFRLNLNYFTNAFMVIVVTHSISMNTNFISF